MSQTNDGDSDDEELTAVEFAAEKIVRTAAESVALAQAKELDPVDDIPAGAEAGHPFGSVPGSVSRGIAGIESEQRIVPGPIPLTVEILQYPEPSNASEMDQSSILAQSSDVS